MKSWIESLFAGSTASKTSRTKLRQRAAAAERRYQQRLRLEFLEDRRQLAPGDASIVGLDLLAEGTPDDDVIIISQSSDGSYLARINEEQFGPFAVPGNVRVLGDAGNDF